ncbi:MAG: hypothetical protein ABUL62_30000 [Myxococcales bacterium]|jgi:hypothetical protein
MKVWRLLVALCVALLVTVSVASAVESDGLSQQVKACADNVAYFRGKIDSTVAHWSMEFEREIGDG